MVGPSKQRRLTQESLYNESGCVTRVSAFAPDGRPLIRIEYIRDAQQRIIEMIAHESGKPPDRSLFSYNDSGLIIQAIELDTNGIARGRLNYDYSQLDSTHIILRKHDARKALSYSIRYTYDGNPDSARLTRIVKTLADGSIDSQVEQAWDGQRRSVKSIRDAANKTTREFRYEYRPDGKLLRLLTVDSSGQVVRQALNEYNSAGLQTAMIERDGQTNPLRRVEYEYLKEAPSSPR